MIDEPSLRSCKHGNWKDYCEICTPTEEAIEIAALKAEVARLRKALIPFAKRYRDWERGAIVSDVNLVRWEDLKHAAEVVGVDDT